MLRNISMTDENGKPIKEKRGLTCSNCHNQLTMELYNYDELENPVTQKGKTLRNKSIEEIIRVVAGGDKEKFKKMVDPGPDELYTFWGEHKGATLVKATKVKGKLKLLPWNAKEGNPVPYEAASAGSDWWLAPSEPHCANCHLAPFVESLGAILS